jgi:predicted RND superfamily exporter protein
MALLANALGFMVIAFVDIEIVRELAYTATIGVTVMIITNKMLLPILLSYYKFTPEQASKLAGKETAGDWLWERIGPLATKQVAWVPILRRARLLAFGLSQAAHLHIGDLGKGCRSCARLALQPGRRDDHAATSRSASTCCR